MSSHAEKETRMQGYVHGLCRGSFVPLWLPELRKARTALSAAGIQVLELRFAPSHIDVEILNVFGLNARRQAKVSTAARATNESHPSSLLRSTFWK